MIVVESREMSVPLAYVNAVYSTYLVRRKLMVKITFAYSLTACFFQLAFALPSNLLASALRYNI